MQKNLKHIFFQLHGELQINRIYLRFFLVHIN